MNPRCQDCDKPHIGMVQWPEEHDDYICVGCLRVRFRELENDNDQIDRYFDEALKYIEGLDARFVELQEEVRGCHADSRELERQLDARREALDEAVTAVERLEGMELLVKDDGHWLAVQTETGLAGMISLENLSGDGLTRQAFIEWAKERGGE